MILRLRYKHEQQYKCHIIDKLLVAPRRGTGRRTGCNGAPAAKLVHQCISAGPARLYGAALDCFNAEMCV